MLTLDDVVRWRSWNPSIGVRWEGVKFRTVRRVSSAIVLMHVVLKLVVLKITQVKLVGILVAVSSPVVLAPKKKKTPRRSGSGAFALNSA
jgi:hypothetical protein